jgi:hypothetical protein
MRDRRRIVWSALLAGCALAFLASSVDAELLHCQGPDGKWVYTDDKSVCPKAKPFEPRGSVQSGGSGGSSAPASVQEGATADRLQQMKARRMAAEAQEAEAGRWRDKKSQLEQAIQDIADRRTYLEKFVTLCNRGGLVYARDASGIKKRIKCSRIEGEYASLDDDAKQAQTNLERLSEDCRRAGCLPGWIR